MDITISKFELKNMLIDAAQMGAEKALERVGKIKPVLTKQEAYKLASRKTVDRAIKAGTLTTIKKGGVTSKEWIDRASFERWVYQNEISSTYLTK